VALIESRLLASRRFLAADRLAPDMLLALALSFLAIHPAWAWDGKVAVWTPVPAEPAILDTSKLHLHSGSALVVDELGQRIYAKRSGVVKPIASITKLMTAMVVLDSGAPLDEPIRILEADRDRLRNSRSRLRINEAELTRGEMLMVALMSSDNRAASALGRTALRGGTPSFVQAMNRKARALGMHDSRFADASGLDATNRSTAEDLVKMVRAAARYPFIRAATTRAEFTVSPYAGGGTLQYRNTNPLVRNDHSDWDIGLSKTGFINEAGRCLVMQASIGGHPLYIVLLGASGKMTPVGDSNRLREWFESELVQPQRLSAHNRRRGNSNALFE